MLGSIVTSLNLSYLTWKTEAVTVLSLTGLFL